MSNSLYFKICQLAYHCASAALPGTSPVVPGTGRLLFFLPLIRAIWASCCWYLRYSIMSNRATVILLHLLTTVLRPRFQGPVLLCRGLGGFSSSCQPTGPGCWGAAAAGGCTRTAAPGSGRGWSQAGAAGRSSLRGHTGWSPPATGRGSQYSQDSW